ncbi:hypothetical protein ACX4MY_19790 [Roseomonas mucosa]|nr:MULTISPECIES: hypothetical protein [Roseomonas]MCG7353451.1 hypothetical protein [Roseomonas mucosa]MCG7358787.1 hypothetical protein [Roseomonas mucosa]MDT8291780.1 hypothetical protein [Roseomonas mucosa]MDT8296400.1 hypothetical protein [Roseomonas mucosa]MDT8315893.1 hypothetical protein [Roseomonas mucosa]
MLGDGFLQQPDHLLLGHRVETRGRLVGKEPNGIEQQRPQAEELNPKYQ